MNKQSQIMEKALDLMDYDILMQMDEAIVHELDPIELANSLESINLLDILEEEDNKFLFGPLAELI